MKDPEFILGGDPKNVSAIMRKIAPDMASTAFRIEAAGSSHSGLAVKYLFTEGRGLGTILLWIPFFMNLLILYFILSWLPALLRQAGMPVSAGITAVMSFSIGGIVGTILQGPLMNKLGVYRAIVTEFACSLILVIVASSIFSNFPVMMLVTFILGVTVQGTQAGLNALSAMYYPTTMRSTGVGWALGVGRVGSIVGPLIGGLMLGMQWTPPEIFRAGAIPALCAMTAVIASNFLQGAQSPYRADAPTPSVAH